MLFNSIEFLLFLPIVFGMYWAVAKNVRLQNLFVIAASYLFYGWWNWKCLLLIAFTTLCSYVCGLGIERVRMSARKSKAVCGLNIVVNLMILGVFKYYDFFALSFHDLMARMGFEADVVTLHLLLPVGISFYTFQALGYTIDVYRNKIGAAHDIAAFFAFLSFFPQLVAGPIERASNLYPQFLRRKRFDYDMAVEGCWMILWGFFKKIVIADGAAVVVNTVFDSAGNYNAATLWIAAILFAFQIYGDFSGYSDIAIGVARLFGIRLMRNFNLPYLSHNVAEFWRRWHISLNTWFVDYLYIPLGGSKGGTLKTLRNTVIVFLVSGLWHGANWTYVAWGAYHALLFVPLLYFGKRRVVPRGRCSRIAGIVVTFLLVTVGWVIFRACDIHYAFGYIQSMLSLNIFSMPDLPKKTLFYAVECFAAIGFLIVMECKCKNKDLTLALPFRSYRVRRIGYIALSVWTFLFYSVGQTFIYFQF